MTNPKFFKSLDKGSEHYKSGGIQPAAFIMANDMLFPEGNVIKYIFRHKLKGKKADVLKAIHYCEMILERDYSDGK